LNGKRLLEISREPNSPEQQSRPNNNNAAKFVDISSASPVTEGTFGCFGIFFVVFGFLYIPHITFVDTVKAMIQNQNTLYQLLVDKVLYQQNGSNNNNNNNSHGATGGFGGKPFRMRVLLFR
jgi:hypothetical protein